MAIGAPGPGTQEVVGSPRTIDIMIDKRYQPSLVENLVLGCAKAHRAVTYSHYEYRNYNRSAQMHHGKVG